MYNNSTHSYIIHSHAPHDPRMNIHDVYIYYAYLRYIHIELPYKTQHLVDMVQNSPQCHRQHSIDRFAYQSTSNQHIQ